MKRHNCLLIFVSLVRASDITLDDFSSKIDASQAPRAIRVLVAQTFEDFSLTFDTVHGTLPKDPNAQQDKINFVAAMLEQALLKESRNIRPQDYTKGNAVAKVQDLAYLLDKGDSDFNDLFSSKKTQAFGDIAKAHDLGSAKKLYLLIATQLMLIHHQAIPFAARLRELSSSGESAARFTSRLSTLAATGHHDDDVERADILNSKARELREAMNFYEARFPRLEDVPLPTPRQSRQNGEGIDQMICPQQ